jgi:hypothetical protein
VSGSTTSELRVVAENITARVAGHPHPTSLAYALRARGVRRVLLRTRDRRIDRRHGIPVRNR